MPGNLDFGAFKIRDGFRKTLSATCSSIIFMIVTTGAAQSGNSAAPGVGNPLTFQLHTAKSQEKYSVIFVNGARMKFVVSRPSTQDSNLFLSIPAAFTTLDGKVDGAYVVDGVAHNSVNRKLGGALKILDGKFEVIDTGGGDILKPSFLEDVAKRKGFLFQQFAVVKNSIASTFKDKSKFQRRGIGKLKDGSAVIVESKQAISLSQFATDLVDLGVRDLIYVDMGAWAEGWVRDPKTGKVLIIGQDRQLTDKQTNWVVLFAPSGKRNSPE